MYKVDNKIDQKTLICKKNIKKYYDVLEWYDCSSIWKRKASSTRHVKIVLPK